MAMGRDGFVARAGGACLRGVKDTLLRASAAAFLVLAALLGMAFLDEIRSRTVGCTRLTHVAGICDRDGLRSRLSSGPKDKPTYSGSSCRRAKIATPAIPAAASPICMGQ